MFAQFCPKNPSGSGQKKSKKFVKDWEIGNLKIPVPKIIFPKISRGILGGKMEISVYILKCPSRISKTKSGDKITKKNDLFPEAWLGLAWPGLAWFGLVWLGLAW